MGLWDLGHDGPAPAHWLQPLLSGASTLVQQDACVTKETLADPPSQWASVSVVRPLQSVGLRVY